MSRQFVEFFASFRLTPAQRRIAQTLVEHSGDVPYLSASEVATMANVSQPSVTRLAVAVGYTGYAEFRQALIEMLALSPSGSELEEPNEYQRAVNSETENLRALGARLVDRTAIRKAGADIMASPVAVALGHRSAAHLAGYFGHYAAKVHSDVRVITAAGSAMTDALLAARDVGAETLVAFLVSRYPVDTVQGLAYARELGFRLILLTDSDVAPGNEWADVLLRADSSSRLIFDSHAAALLAASMLVQAMCDEDPARVQRRLEDLERSLKGRRVYVT
ncbi:MurR/RpiR family transcriptional regulator [Acrocarpospora catenulata]|uniref:MurR/RpiR family transcriptional regulator n=1 Tax=Acrocarpospora catenulata TaxID=2836182 RepID=UPI001BD92514|nr:MurR/RpiR family transcriptional regulator [Acrocarpospora catenulata]